MIKMITTTRTIVAALNPRRYQDSFTEIYLKVWFEELSEPVTFLATPFDCERHGKELWIRAMGGEYGPIEVLPSTLIEVLAQQQQQPAASRPLLLIEHQKVQP